MLAAPAAPPEAVPDARIDRVLLGVALAMSTLLLAGGFWRWPWDHDEVLSLAELGVVPPDQYPGPLLQVQKIRIILPVWYHLQRAALSVLPVNEFGARVLPVCAALLLVLVTARWAMRRNVRFASSLVLTAGCSPMLLWLAQQNRFYSLALCLMAGALYTASSRRTEWQVDVVASILCLAAVLSHNLTLIVFALAFAAAVAVHWTAAPRPLLVRRTASMAALGAITFAVYLRPALAGWMSGGTGGTPPVVSYLAQFGLWTAGLALVGAVVILESRGDTEMQWWLWMAAGSVAFVALSLLGLKAWNPRYALFFMWPAWVIAARGTEAIAERLEHGWWRAAWFGAVLLMMAPKVLSHEVDGTRHDFRSAAAAVASQQGATTASNWPATLQYYLERAGQPQKVKDWQRGMRLPEGAVILVFASNGWEPVLSFAGRSSDVVAEIRSRRFDEQSHVIRVYRVGPRDRAVRP